MMGKAGPRGVGVWGRADPPQLPGGRGRLLPYSGGWTQLSWQVGV